jgi:hypothetical protein
VKHGIGRYFDADDGTLHVKGRKITLPSEEGYGDAINIKQHCSSQAAFAVSEITLHITKLNKSFTYYN